MTSKLAWDSRQPIKLSVFLLSATVVGKGKQSTDLRSLSCNLYHLKTKHHSKVIKKTLEPRWEEFFLFEIPKPIDGCISADHGTMRIKVVDSSGLTKAEVGHVTIDIASLSTEKPINRCLDLIAPVKKKKSDATSSAQPPPSPGRVRVALYVSTQPEIRRSVAHAPLAQDHFTFADKDHSYEPGDLLLYSGSGPAQTLCKMTAGQPWSMAAIVVAVPNKWTGDPELCVLEFGRNTEAFTDLYAEKATHYGPMLYRLFERIHGVPGTEVWLMKRKKNGTEQGKSKTESDVLMRWALKIHMEFVSLCAKLAQRGPRLIPPLPFPATEFPANQLAFLQMFDPGLQNTSTSQMATSVCDLYTTELAARGLKEIGVQVNPSEARHVVMVQDLVALDGTVFEKPRLVRCRPELSRFPFWPDEETQPTQPQTTAAAAFQPPPLPPPPMPFGQSFAPMLSPLVMLDSTQPSFYMMTMPELLQPTLPHVGGLPSSPSSSTSFGTGIGVSGRGYVSPGVNHAVDPSLQSMAPVYDDSYTDSDEGEDGDDQDRDEPNLSVVSAPPPPPPSVVDGSSVTVASGGSSDVAKPSSFDSGAAMPNGSPVTPNSSS